MPPPPLSPLLLLLVAALRLEANTANVTSGGAAMRPMKISAGGCGGAAAWRAAAEATALALRAGGVAAEVEPTERGAAAICSAGGLPRDSPYCLSALLIHLNRRGGAEVCAMVGDEAADCLPVWLRDNAIADLGDSGPATRRQCLVTSASASVSAPAAPAPALRDLRDPATARLYSLQPLNVSFIRKQAANSETNCEGCERGVYTPPQCRPSPGGGAGDGDGDGEAEGQGEGDRCGWMLVGDTGELAVLRDVVRREGLLVRIAALGDGLSEALRRLAGPSARLLFCAWRHELDELRPSDATPLAVPPCPAAVFACDPAGPRERETCPFASRRVAVLAYGRDLVRVPLLARALRRLGAGEARDGTEDDRTRPEPQVAVLLAAGGARAAPDVAGQAAGALLAEEEGGLRVQLQDDRCSGRSALRVLARAVSNAGRGALAAVAGPQCGAALRQARALAAVFRVPVLAVTPAAAAAGEGGSALLAGGEAAARWAALGAELEERGWRRVALLTDDSLPLEAPLRPRLDLALHRHLHGGDAGDAGEDEGERHLHLIYEMSVKFLAPLLHNTDPSGMVWGRRVEQLDLRILVVSVESATALAAAVCAAAGAGAGAGAAAGRVVLLPREPPPQWLDAPPPSPLRNCSVRAAAAALAAVLAVEPQWSHEWSPTPQWRERWTEKCREWARMLSYDETSCSRPTPRAALLYDTLRLWGDAVAGLRRRFRNLEDLRDPDVIRLLIEYATKSNLSLLTGPFEWNIVSRSSEVVATRRETLLVTQVNAGEGGGGGGSGGGGEAVARWSEGRYRRLGEVRWRSPDALQPRDAPPCALQPLADLLDAECAAALPALLGALLAAMLALAAATALLARCRLRRHYRERLQRELRQLTRGAAAPARVRWEIPRSDVTINRVIGVGAFGVVYGGTALLPAGGRATGEAGGAGPEVAGRRDRVRTAVAVKMLCPNASLEDKVDFLSEAEIMKRFDHGNIVRLLSVITASEPICVVMELQLYGDLKNYLLARRHLAEAEAGVREEEDEVSPRRLTSLALDAARALSYLAEKRYVHCDVAARNCLVSARRRLKLGDFGMARSVLGSSCYQAVRARALPLRWMAPESVRHKVFSPASDVWSYGVLLYEIVTFGATPHRELPAAAVPRALAAGASPPLPPGLRPKLQALMKACWSVRAEARPAAHELVAFLADAPDLLTASVGGGPAERAGGDAAPAGAGTGAGAGDGAGAPGGDRTDLTYLSDELVTLLAD